MNTIFSHFEMTKVQRSGFLFLLGLIVSAQIVIFILNQNKGTPETKPIPQELIALQRKLDSVKIKSQKALVHQSIELKPFNPNALDKKGWMELGFTEDQAEVWIKYRYVVGGNFSSLKQIKDCYILSEEKYNQLKPFIHLSVVNRKKAEPKYNLNKKYIQPKPIKLKEFNPNHLNEAEWIKLGFSKSQVNTILKYKYSLGGEFKSLAQIKACYVISDKKFKQLKPYIKFEKKKSPKTIQKKINPNLLSLKQWINLGFSKKESEGILEYKEFIGGRFFGKEQIKKCDFISVEMYNKIESRLIFDSIAK